MTVCILWKYSGRYIGTNYYVYVIILYPHCRRYRSFQTSAQRQAFFMTPLARGLVAIGARLTRSWWKRLTPERREAWRAALGRRRGIIYGSVGLLGLGAAGFYYSHVESAPVTGRRRFLMFSRDDVVKLIEEDRKTLVKELVGENAILPQKHPTYQSVLSVISQILSKNWEKWGPIFEGLHWSLYIVDSPEVNAVCLPSGEIFVFAGLIAACHNKEELAFILSHEISHAVLGHGIEALSKRGVIDFFMLFLVATIWAIVPNDLVSYALHGWSHSTAELLFHLPYSRQLESEADEVGLMFAANACFEPEKAVKVWKHLPAPGIENDEVAEYFSTHPNHARRYEQLSALMPSARAVWRENRCEVMKEEVEGFQLNISRILKKTFKFW